MNKIWNGIKNVVRWLVYSSANAEQISLMVRGVFVGIIPTILVVSRMMNIQLDNQILTTIVDGICTAIVYVGGAISALAIVGGALRKIWSTITGKNEVIAAIQAENSY